MLSDEGSRLYREMAPRFASERELVEAALAALEARNMPTDAELLDMLRARLAERQP